METEKSNLFATGVFIFLGLLAIVALIGTVLMMGGFWQESEVALPVMLITGLISLLVAIASIVAVFKTLNLANRDFALGLPQGTVRAMIALSLILIFMTTSVFLFGQLSKGIITESIDFPMERIDLVKERILSLEKRVVEKTHVVDGEEVPVTHVVDGKEVPVDPDTFYDVKLVRDVNEASKDFAKQILTTVSTLVVALAGFYFGAKSVVAPRGEKAPSVPVISNIDPDNGKQGAMLSEVTIHGSNFQLPKEVKLVRGNKEIPAPKPDIMSSATLVKCSFKIPNDAEKGPWDLIVVNEGGGEVRKPEAFNVV